MTIKDLKAAIATLPDNMIVGINESTNEATGIARSIKVCKGPDECPYDKGDNPYQTETVEEDTPICFINS